METKKIPTRNGFGEAIVELGRENKDIVVVDIDIGKSCKTGDFRKELPDQYLNVGIAEQNGYGYWCPSNDVNAFTQCVDKMLACDLAQMGENGYQFYLNNYTIEHTYNAIMKHF